MNFLKKIAFALLASGALSLHGACENASLSVSLGQVLEVKGIPQKATVSVVNYSDYSVALSSTTAQKELGTLEPREGVHVTLGQLPTNIICEGMFTYEDGSTASAVVPCSSCLRLVGICGNTEQEN